jgi:hypothetical protein
MFLFCTTSIILCFMCSYSLVLCCLTFICKKTVLWGSHNSLYIHVTTCHCGECICFNGVPPGSHNTHAANCVVYSHRHHHYSCQCDSHLAGTFFFLVTICHVTKPRRPTYFFHGVYKLLSLYEIAVGSMSSVHQNAKVLWESDLLERIKQ